MTNDINAPAGRGNAAAPATSGTTAAATGKSIILFSDGTGNSSAKLFKTNVWRMYEAVDLGPPADDKRAQIAYYDDGVGTSSFKPLTLLGGAFGSGLHRNVLDLYRYACRNYRQGDQLYAFGFSRGAFTIRLAVALIASEGLVPSTSEAELVRKSRAAYRGFRAGFLPRHLKAPTIRARKIRGAIDRWIERRQGHPAYNPSDNLRPTIRFVGVWDTVAAYGGPIIEITRAIDNWIYPLSMPDYQLDERVLCARHALAIDDERDAFHPLLWDEVHEAALVGQDKVSKTRLEQVWFTGMHADVGGGYPDEALSYVSLLWMMEEAEKAGLRTLKVIKERIMALASSYGPLHDSRGGLSAYYRYQPRRIAAWIDPGDPRTHSLRDPAITDPQGTPRGLLRSVKVHESVINRIATGTDRYAPITLPEFFEIVPPQVEGETSPQSDNQTPDSPPKIAGPTTMVSRSLRARLNDPIVTAARARASEAIWDLVWWRRLTYFATLTATLLLLSMPLVVDRLPSPPVLADGRTWIGGLIRLSTLVLPSFAGQYVEVYANNPFYFFVLGGVIYLFLRIGTSLERTLRDESRRLWKRATEGGTAPARHQGWVGRFRNSARYQAFVHRFKWHFLPDWVVAPLILGLLLWIGLAASVQSGLPFLENAARLCPSSPAAVTEIAGVRGDFRTEDVCSESFGLVTAGQQYAVTFDVVDPWYDTWYHSRFPASPEGISAGNFPWGIGYPATAFRRVVTAHYLQPVLAVRPARGSGFFRGNVQIHPLAVRHVGDSETLYRAEFVAPRSGQLFLFVNDAVIPVTAGWVGDYDYRYFYRSSAFGNGGSACVTVRPLNRPNAPLHPPVGGSICARAVEREAARAAAARAQGHDSRPTS